MIHGLRPGPEMLTKHLDITYSLVWSTVLANILATGIALLFTNQLAKIATIRIHILAPLIIVVVFLAAFQTKASMGDLIALFSIAIVGWFMKRCGWPRPPLLLGFVLGGIIERYLSISIQTYGASFLLRPLVIVIFLFTVAMLVYSLMQERLAGKLRS
jgi:TctA family transporter